MAKSVSNETYCESCTDCTFSSQNAFNLWPMILLFVLVLKISGRAVVLLSAYKSVPSRCNLYLPRPYIVDLCWGNCWVSDFFFFFLGVGASPDKGLRRIILEGDSQIVMDA